jgi:hypothetical protein
MWSRYLDWTWRGSPRGSIGPARQMRRWQRQLDASRSRPLAGIDELRG